MRASTVLARLPVIDRPQAERILRAVGWRLLVPALRARARRRIGGLRPGQATIVTVNWNSWGHLAVIVELVKRRSLPGTQILVVDNGSQDESRRRLAELSGVSTLLLPANLGHDLALELGVLLCRTEYVVTLDVDAFPLREGWIEELTEPLRQGAQVSGARLNRGYVHPCCLAMRTQRFLERGHSFRSDYRPRSPGQDASGDVGEGISAREAPHLHFLEVTSQRGPQDVGTVFGELIYHNFYATRFSATKTERLDGAVRPTDAVQAWDEALRRYVD
jgi:hypothetical protein